MDFARQIGKSDEPRVWKKSRLPFVTTRDNLLTEDTPFSEDPRFVNWRKWLARRKRQNRRVEFASGRSQTDQLQSSSERFREFVEMKNLIEHASVPVIIDKYRGAPGFWKTPEFLPSHCDTSLPEVSLTLTRKDLNLPPDLLHVGLADLIANERDVVGLKAKEEPWKRSEYLKVRKHELAKEIALLLPKEPETATLVVQGHAFREEKSQPRVPPITITEPDEERSRECADQTTVLKIQDREFVWRKSFVRTEPMDIVWFLTFPSEIDERVEREIVLENKGTRVIAYYWRNSSVQSASMSFVRRGQPFFFNKTKSLILPGQTVRIKVWYLSRARGVFTESWRLVTQPKLCSSAFTFRLWGCTNDVRSAKLTDLRTIDEYLDRCVRDSTVRSIVEDIMAGVDGRVEPTPASVYKTLFLQSELFSSLNPYHFYHPSIVMQLREMHSRVIDGTAPSWNLLLDTIRDMLLQIDEKDHRRDMLARFNDLCKQCLRPNLYEVARDNKSNAVYDVLCAFANIFEDESEFVKNSLIYMREESVIESKIDLQKLKHSSQRSINSSQEIHSAKSIDQSETVQSRKEEKTFHLNLQLYREVFFIRIYKTLEETIERVCAIIDSYNRLNEPYK